MLHTQPEHIEQDHASDNCYEATGLPVEQSACKQGRQVKKLLVVFCSTLLSACTNLPSTKEPVTNAERWLGESIPAIATAIRQRDISAEALVTNYQQRISAIDQAGPALQSVLALNPLALERARALDALLADGQNAGPLHGVPVLLKDNIEAAGPLPTTAGSTALANNVTNRDSPLVAGLRDAGAIILGKANLSQWANFRSSQSLSGWSAIGGQVKNPHILDRNPCGSSSGSGAAVAAALTAGAVGTETNGSIICPSNVNGIVGFKPTVGLVSAQHIVPISTTQDTAGPMTRSVMGAAMMLDAMTGKAEQAPYSSALPAASLRNVRLGVLRYSVGENPHITKKFAAALQALENQGAVLVDIDEAPERPENFRASSFLVMGAEFKQAINSYLADTPPEVEARSLSALIAYNEANAQIEMPLFGQDIFATAQASVDLDSEEYRTALASIQQATRVDGIDALLQRHNLSAVIFPSGPLASQIDPINGDVWPQWVGDGTSAAIAGYPHLSVPMGTVHGLPIGLSFVASAGSDAKVLSLGYVFEQATRLRAQPEFLPTAGAQTDLKEALRRR